VRIEDAQMPSHLLFGEPLGQSWIQLTELAFAFVLSAIIGLEREIRQKSAGLRTYTLVGFSSALIMLVSKYGFTDILETAASSSILPALPPRSSRVSGSSAAASSSFGRTSFEGLQRRPRCGLPPPWAWPLALASRSLPWP
jgi:MgtC family